jgi:folylpolyglutamate synthase/dihydropteroate synthase
MVDAALRAAGHRSARYTSPHLVDLTSGSSSTAVPCRDALARRRRDVRDAIDGLRATAARGAADLLRSDHRRRVRAVPPRRRRIAVPRSRLGGRLDATNVVARRNCSRPRSRRSPSTISSISVRSLREIALEKGRHHQAGVPVVVGPLEPDAAAAIDDVARQRGAAVIRASAGDCDG